MGLSSLIFDTHAHYDDPAFEDNFDSLINEMQESNVGGIITCGCDKESSLKALALAEAYDIFYAAVGIHPGSIDSGTTVEEIEALAKHPKCVAIGEIGLDYYWRQDNKAELLDILKYQLELANKLDLPVLFHDRDGHADTLEILKQYKPKGVVHAFSGSVEMAREIIKLGLYIGVGGVLTFNNARALPSVVGDISLDKILLETDAPYLAPVPFRGKPNRSDYIIFVAEKMAEIKEITINDVLAQTFKNAQNLFNL